MFGPPKPTYQTPNFRLGLVFYFFKLVVVFASGFFHTRGLIGQKESLIMPLIWSFLMWTNPRNWGPKLHSPSSIGSHATWTMASHPLASSPWPNQDSLFGLCPLLPRTARFLGPITWLLWLAGFIFDKRWLDNYIIGFIPIGSMYGIFTYLFTIKHQPNVGICTRHGFYGINCLFGWKMMILTMLIYLTCGCLFLVLINSKTIYIPLFSSHTLIYEDQCEGPEHTRKLGAQKLTPSRKVWLEDGWED